ncbi:Hypothetical predicted protein [Podarcis lilfordi]|uniref:Uncharacterized protein n=1 Tax=Podarcis lilfordi TaxID=74358 RepID=A0AA35PS25_9SAUR|nr:Hypothetical predicted protein [Podarcis lilfordi]
MESAVVCLICGILPPDVPSSLCFSFSKGAFEMQRIPARRGFWGLFFFAPSSFSPPHQLRLGSCCSGINWGELSLCKLFSVERRQPLLQPSSPHPHDAQFISFLSHEGTGEQIIIKNRCKFIQGKSDPSPTTIVIQVISSLPPLFLASLLLIAPLDTIV